jgi:HlyD family type I secretion membrane fusion protein
MTATLAAGAAPAPPTGIRWLALAGLAVLAGTFGGLALWSATMPLSSAAVAPGSVVVDSNRKAVQHLEGGTVKAIRVKEGDRVAAGQLLVELDNARVATVLAALEPLVLINAAQRARLAAERRGEGEIVFPAELLGGGGADRQAILEDQRAFLAKRRAALDSARARLAGEREQALALAQGLDRQAEFQRSSVELTQQELGNNEKLAAKGSSSQQRVREVRRALAQFLREEEDLRTQAEEQRRKAEASALEIRRVEDEFAERVETELQAAERERYQLAQRLGQAHEELDRLRVVAPVTGTVVNLVVHTVNGVVAPQATLLEIVPADDPLVIEARVRPVDIEGLEPGMPVEVRFPGLRDKRLPRLQGRLETVSADLVTDGGSTGASPYFRARARVGDDALRVVGRENLRPGMPVEIMIIKGSRTVVEYLLGQAGDFLAHAMRE